MSTSAAKPVVSYAQQLEDVLLWRPLKHIKNGVYVDIGACEPVLGSVSLLFYELGWRGIHVEPVPKTAEMLREARPDELVLEAAVSNTRANGVTLFNPLVENLAGLATLDVSAAKASEALGFKMKEMKVDTITIDDVFARCDAPEIHWLKIDVEAHEKKVLEAWTSPRRPWLVAVESLEAFKNTLNHQQWENLLVDLDYEFAWSDLINRFYIHKSHPELREGFLHSPNIFDGFVLSKYSAFFTELAGQAAEEKYGYLEATLADVNNRLEQATKSLQEITGSLSWKMVRPFWRLAKSLRKRFK